MRSEFCWNIYRGEVLQWDWLYKSAISLDHHRLINRILWENVCWCYAIDSSKLPFFQRQLYIYDYVVYTMSFHLNCIGKSHPFAAGYSYPIRIQCVCSFIFGICGPSIPYALKHSIGWGLYSVFIRTLNKRNYLLFAQFMRKFTLTIHTVSMNIFRAIIVPVEWVSSGSIESIFMWTMITLCCWLLHLSTNAWMYFTPLLYFTMSWKMAIRTSFLLWTFIFLLEIVWIIKKTHFQLKTRTPRSRFYAFSRGKK